MTQDTRTTALTERAQLIHHVIRVHARRGAHTCSCTYEYPLGTDTTLHVADAIDAALAMLELGNTTTAVHQLLDMLECITADEPDPRTPPPPLPPR